MTLAPRHPPQHPPHIAEVVGRDKWWHEWNETDDGNEERFERLFNFNLLDLLDVRSEQMPLEFFSAWARTMHVQFAVHAAYSCAFSWWIFCLLWTMDPLHVQNSVGTTSSNIIGTYNIKLFPAHFCSVAPFRFDAPEAKVARVPQSRQSKQLEGALLRLLKLLRREQQIHNSVKGWNYRNGTLAHSRLYTAKWI